MDNRTERLAEDVWRIEARWGVNTYLLAGTDGLTLVDTGTAGAGPSIVRSIRLLDHDPHSLDTLVLTHWHGDHTGSAARFAASSAAPRVLTGRRDLAAVTGRVARPQTQAAAGDASRTARLCGRIVKPGAAVAAEPLEDGDRLEAIAAVVVDSPGHTAGSISLHLPGRGVLLAGDAVFNILRLTRGPGITRSARTQEVATLQRLAALDFDVLAVGHGPPVVTDARRRLQRLADRVA